MKKTLLALTVVSPLILSLTGCVVSVNDGGWEADSGWSDSWEDRQKQNRQMISELDLGMSVTQVRNRLGQPDFTEVHNENGEKVHVLFYRTQRNRGDGETTKDECTALIFKQDGLDSWGEKALSDLN